MNIQEFLARVNENEVAQAIGVSVHTVRKWRTGDRVPSRERAQALIEWSHGVLSFESIFTPVAKQAA
jgi:hypothetical protein